MSNYQPPGSMDDPFDRKTEEFVKENAETEIHKVMRVEHFEQLIGVSSLKVATISMMNVMTWEDVNEGFRYKMQNWLLDGSKVASYESFLRRIYGHCWSLNSEEKTCYMWHCYHPECKGRLVQVSTTIGQLWNSVRDANLQPTDAHFFYLRKMKYKSIARLKKQLNISIEEQAIDGPEAWQQFLIETLFAKNEPFHYEREIRLLYEKVSHSNPTNDHLMSSVSFRIDPKRLINKVVASPFMNDHDLVCLRCKMKNSKMGDDSRLSQSQLFK